MPQSPSTFSRQILKQTKKIVRLLSKITQEYPQTSQGIDLAIYATMQIEKIVGRKQNEVGEGGGERYASGERGSDLMFQGAMQQIEGFRQVTAKLDSKINVLVNQSEHLHHPHPHHKQPTAKRQYPSRSRQLLKQIKLPKRSRPAPAPLPTKIKQQEQDGASRSLSSIDHSILKLTSEILQMGPVAFQREDEEEEDSAVQEYQEEQYQQYYEQQ